MDGLFEAVEELRPRTVAVVGLAKNCGKTTALNRLAAEYAERGVPLALTSAGRDGEAIDALTRAPKPAVEVRAGMLAATAEGTLDRWTAPLERVGRLDVQTAMGEVVVVRATAEGGAELAGPPTVATVMAALDELSRLGAERILVDGAFDRIAVGHPGVADAVVLAAGAVLGASVESVAGAVGHRVDVLSLPLPDAESAARLTGVAEALGPRAAAVTEGFDVTVVPETALTDPAKAADTARDARWLVCGGAVTEGLVGALLEAGARTEVVARDATRIFIDAGTLRRWLGSGGGLYVLGRVNLAAMVTNPHNPTGVDLDAAELAGAVARAVGDLPVFDVVAGIAENCGGAG